MDVLVELKLNQCTSIQYVISYGVGDHKSALFHVLIYVMGLVLEKVKLNAATNYYEALLTQFFPYRGDTNTGISNILADNPSSRFTIKISCDQMISSITG